MSAPTQGRVQASELRPRASEARTSCGFCEGAHGQAPSVCQDIGGHCQGPWPRFVGATDADPDSSWARAFSAAGHPNQDEAKAS